MMDQVVIDALQRATNQDPNILKPAEHTLKQWESEQGFYKTLYNVYANRTLPVDVRCMAILYLKNGTDRYWRRFGVITIQSDEKEFLRQHLISNFEEPINHLAIQLAVVIAKIARYDYPKYWNSLVPTLLKIIEGQNTLAQHRALLTLHQVVKSLASKPLSADRKMFVELTANIFGFILNYWNSYTESFLVLASNQADVNQIQVALEKALLLLRILKKLIFHGFTNLSESKDAMMFLQCIFQRTRSSIECRKTLISRSIFMDVCDKFIIHCTKVLIGVQERQPFSFVELIPISLEFSVYYCFTEGGQVLTFERLIIQCLALLRNILSTNKYELAKNIEGSDKQNPLTLKAHQLKQEFFTPHTLTEICTKLVTHYFLLTPADLDLWDRDPENFAIYPVGESWKYGLRFFTESTFVALFHLYRDILAPVLVNLTQQHHQPVDPHDLHAILLKDAVYNAVGLAAFDLYDEVNFDQWFLTTLKQELSVRSNHYKIIRKRVCWLIGHWTSVKLSPELRPILYKLMVEALSPTEDLGVRLAASEALKLAIDDFQFNTEEFFPYLESAFSLLFILLRQVYECDTKMQVLYVLSFMIERVGNAIQPHVNTFIAYLPGLWQQSEEHNILRCAIVSTLVHLEKALGSSSVLLQPLVTQVVALSCDVHQDSHVYLLQDGLELWLAFLENAPATTLPMLDLFKYMPAVIESSLENLQLCLYITQAYLLLSPIEFLRENGETIIEILLSIKSDLSLERELMVLRLVETIIRVSPESGAELIKPLLLKFIEGLAMKNDSSLLMELCIISRVLLKTRHVFFQVINELRRTKLLEFEYEMDLNGYNEEQIFETIVRTWLLCIIDVSQPEQSKLLALGLCSLLTIDLPDSIKQSFSKIITRIVEVLNDITRIDMGVPIDSLLITEQTPQLETYYHTEHAQRRRRLMFSDPVYTLCLKETFQNQLHALRSAIGDDQFNQFMNTVDHETLRQLSDYISI